MLIKDNQILLHVHDLISYGVSKETIKSGLKRNKAGHHTWQNMVNPDDRRQRLIIYDSLPRSTKEKLPAAGELRNLIEADQTYTIAGSHDEKLLILANNIKKHEEIKDYRLFLSWISDKVKANDLMQGAGILRFLASYITKRDTITLGYNSKKDLRKDVVNHIEREATMRGRHLYMFKVTSPAVLQQKELNWRKAFENSFERHSNKDLAYHEQLKTLLHSNLENDNALTFDKAHQDIALTLYLQPQKLDMFRIYLDYQIICEREGLAACAYSTVKKYLRSDKVQALAAGRRHGAQYAETKFRPFHHRTKPQQAFSMVAGDGWFPGRSVMVHFNDRRTGQPIKKAQTCAVWLWFDASSDAIVGFGIAPTETGELIRESFRQIMILHNDVCPKSVLIDASWAKRQEIELLFKGAGVRIEHKRAYNPKANPAERNNRELNRLHRQLDEHWASMTTNTIEYKHNPDNLKGAKSMNEDEFRQMIVNLINIYNNTQLPTGKTRLQVLHDNMPAETHTIDALERVRVFGFKKIVTIRSGVLQLNIGTKKYEYEVPDWQNLIGKTARKCSVKVYYDESYMDTVDIYNYQDKDDDNNDEYLTSCPRLNRYNMAPVEQTQQDKETLGHHEKRGKDYDQWVEQNLPKINLDVKGMNQERYKDALSSEMAKLYQNVYADQEAQRGNLVQQPGYEKTLEQRKRELARLEYEKKYGKRPIN